MKPRPADETGILIHEGRHFVLSVAGGGHWRLEPLCRIDTDLLGVRVRAQGQGIVLDQWKQS